MSKIIKAPFTDDEVNNLNDYQVSGIFHEFTCGNQGDDAHIKFEFEKKYKKINFETGFKIFLEEERRRGVNYPEAVFNSTSLIATKKGWICPVCDYKQNWAHEFMSVKQF